MVVARIIQQYPNIDPLLIKELVKLGYSEDELKAILNALGKNANNAGYVTNDPKRTRFMNMALTAIIQRFQDELNSGDFQALLNVGYKPKEARTALFTNLLSTTQLLARTKDAHISGEYQRLHQLGLTKAQVRSKL